MQHFKYLAKLSTSIAFLFLIAGCSLLFSGRTVDRFRFAAFENILSGFYQHISNFTISCILFVVIGLMWLMLGVKFRVILLLGLVFISVNFIYELFIPILNTPDIVDAYYGTAGVLVALPFLYITSKVGLMPNEKYKPM